MRATTLAAGGLACAGAAMTIAAFAGGGSAKNEPPARTASATPHGLRVFIANGCGGCHTFKAAHSNAPIGPDIGRSLDGRDRDYVMRAIVLPGAELAPNYGDVMPGDFAERIAPDDLRALVDFLAQ